jgi:hypothetical protein
MKRGTAMSNVESSSNMRHLVDHWSLSTLFVFLLIKLLQGVKRLFPPKEDGWRRTTRAYLRSEQDKFGYGSFCIKPLPEAAITNDTYATEMLVLRLSDFLKRYPFPYITLDWGHFPVKISSKQTCDVVLVQYSQEGSILSLKPYLDHALPGLPPDQEQEVLMIIQNSYNKTKDLPDKTRPKRLKKAVMKGIQLSYHHMADRERADAYANRVLSSVYVCLDSLDDKNMFQDPEFVRMKHPGFAALQLYIQCDFIKNDATVWILCSHIAADGMPIMEMMQDLKREWGESRSVLYPKSGTVTNPVCCSAAGVGIYHTGLFLDFTSFFEERKRMIHAYGVDIPVLALFLWKISRHPVFTLIKFSLPLDIEKTADLERSLAFLYIRPSKYYDEKALENGFLNFLSTYSRWQDSTKRRTSAGYKILEALAIMPPASYITSLMLFPKAIRSVFGTMGVSVVKDAEFMIGSKGDINADGMLSFGCLKKPSCDGGSVGVVSIKGSKQQIAAYQKALQEIFNVSTY